MKITGVYAINQNEEPHCRAVVWPDSVLIRSGKPLFIDKKRNTFIHFGVGVRADIVGKSVKPKFAQRYYHSLTLFAIFLSEKSSEALMCGQDPLACDLVADYSVIAGNFIDKSECGNSADILIEWENIEADLSSTLSQGILEINFLEKINDALSGASETNTIKTGDMVFIFIPNVRIEAESNRILRLQFNKTIVLENKIK